MLKCGLPFVSKNARSISVSKSKSACRILVLTWFAYSRTEYGIGLMLKCVCKNRQRHGFLGCFFLFFPWTLKDEAAFWSTRKRAMGWRVCKDRGFFFWLLIFFFPRFTTFISGRGESADQSSMYAFSFKRDELRYNPRLEVGMVFIFFPWSPLIGPWWRIVTWRSKTESLDSCAMLYFQWKPLRKTVFDLMVTQSEDRPKLMVS